LPVSSSPFFLDFFFRVGFLDGLRGGLGLASGDDSNDLPIPLEIQLPYFVGDRSSPIPEKPGDVG
jgi:hypothetical protein